MSKSYNYLLTSNSYFVQHYLDAIKLDIQHPDAKWVSRLTLFINKRVCGKRLRKVSKAAFLIGFSAGGVEILSESNYCWSFPRARGRKSGVGLARQQERELRSFRSAPATQNYYNNIMMCSCCWFIIEFAWAISSAESSSGLLLTGGCVWSHWWREQHNKSPPRRPPTPLHPCPFCALMFLIIELPPASFICCR